MTARACCATYLIASENNRVIYTGVTGDLVARTWTHRELPDPSSFGGFYRARKLVYYELHATMEAAITREKQIKRWRRSKKVDLIARRNPLWRDLWPEIAGSNSSS